MGRRFPQIRAWGGSLSAAFVLLLLFFYTYGFFVRFPYAGFLYHPGSGEVQEVYGDPAAPNAIQQRDRILQVGNITWTAYLADNTQPLFRGLAPGEMIPIRVLRDGQEINLSYMFLGPTQAEIVSRFNSQWFLPYIFWLAGIATWLFLRPRNTLTWLIAFFNYINAIWLSAGVLALSHEIGSAIVLKAGLWLLVPVAWHLHWLFPVPFRRLSNWVVVMMYIAGAGLAMAEVLQLLPRSSQYLSLALAFLGSLVLQLLHFIFQPAHRRIFGVFFAAFAIALAPLLVLSILGSFGIHPWYSGIALLGVPALPGFYFFIIYRNQVPLEQTHIRRFFFLYLTMIAGGLLLYILVSLLPAEFYLPGNYSLFQAVAALSLALIAVGAFAPFLILPALSSAPLTFLEDLSPQPRIRANQAATFIFFFLMLVPVAVALALVLNRYFFFPGVAVLNAIVTSLVIALIALATYKPFERFFEKRVLGMPHPPETLIRAYAERIATRLSRTDLVTLLTGQILPTLLVRQSALLTTSGRENFRTLFAMGLPQDQIPSENVLQSLLPLSGMLIPPSQAAESQPIPSWLRLCFALKVNDQVIGLWLLGHRDPDDTYSPSEIGVLQILATNIAVALANIQQAETLHALYTTNIQEHEKERSRLALEIHDNVLSSIAAMQFLPNEHVPPVIYQNLSEIADRLRQTVDDLRPPMLFYGLHAALAGLLDDQYSRYGQEVTLEFGVEESIARFPDQVERHIYRIVQQALDNALRHARARKVTLSGRIDPNCISLEVTDDGIGFTTGSNLDISDLLQERHFGLAGILERATIIDANVEISSQFGEGTRIHVVWEPVP